METTEQVNCPLNYEEIIESWYREDILGLIEEEKFFIELRNKNLFDDRTYEKTWHYTVDLIRAQIEKEVNVYQQRFNKKFIPN